MVDDIFLDVNLRKCQNQIGYVPQDIFLLDDTIKNNIAFGLNAKDINQEKILNSFNDVLVENRGVITSIINNALNEKGRRELI